MYRLTSILVHIITSMTHGGIRHHQKNYGQWYVTDKCYYWIDKDYKRSWRLGDMRIEFDDYKEWDLSSDPLYKEYKKECEHSDPMYGRNDSVAQQSAAKLVELINRYLKY